MDIVLFDKTYTLTEKKFFYELMFKNIAFEFHIEKGICFLSIWEDMNGDTFDEELFATKFPITNGTDITNYILEPIIQISIKYNLGLVDEKYGIII